MLVRRIHSRLRRMILLLILVFETEAVLEAWLRAFIEMVSAVVGIRSIHVVLVQNSRPVVAVGGVREMLVESRCLAGLHIVQAGVRVATRGSG